MRVCVIGAGVAGALLAWRLAQLPAVEQVVLAPGPAAAPRCHRGVRRGSPRLRDLSPSSAGWRSTAWPNSSADPTGCGTGPASSSAARCTCLPTPPALPAAIAEIEAGLPGSASLLDAAELTRRGWAGLDAARGRPAGGPGRLPQPAAVAPARCWPIWPSAARVRMLADGEVTDLQANEFTLDRRGGTAMTSWCWRPAPGRRAAAARGTATRPAGLRTKGIQYTVHRASGGAADHLRRRPDPAVRQADSGRRAARLADRRLGRLAGSVAGRTWR